MKIEKFGSSEYEELIEVWDDSVRATHDYLQEEYIEQAKGQILNSYFQQIDLWGIKENEVIIGFIGLSSDEITMLFVKPDYFRQGIGSKLIKFAISQGHNKITVNVANEQAIKFYLHHNFVKTAYAKNDDQGNNYPIWTMTRQ